MLYKYGWALLFLLAAMLLYRTYPTLQQALRNTNFSPSNLSRFSTATAMASNPSAKDDSAPDNRMPLGLPEPGHEATKLDVSTGEGVRFDALGPMVVNVDGTLSRITNWEKMAPIEKENTLRILSKRNKARLDALKKNEGEDS